ncbi:MAG TPA: hypothetical protein VLI94_00045 [Solirubrobacterales bacterium]|nr:hypothetical protein [Solirubrobacterales bacterium]
MIRNLKSLGLAQIVVLALSAVVASAASAEGEYTAAEYPVTMTATSALGNDVFTTEGGTWECQYHYEATLTEASASLTAKVTTTGCKAFGFATATVTMHGCDYRYETPTALTTHSGPPVTHTWTIPLKIACSPGSEITIIAGNCEIRIPEQTPGGHVSIAAKTNTPASPDDITAQATVTGMAYTVVKDGFLCPFAGTGEKTGATYNQKNPVTLSSTNGKSITIS